MPPLKEWKESGSWRHPIDVVTILENGFKELPVALEKGKLRSTSTQRQQKTEDTLVATKTKMAY
jgi:hypothetical protein